MKKGTSVRYSEIDLYKGFGIILLLCSLSEMLPKGVQNCFDSVCFPLFMLAAGIVSYRRGYEADEKDILKEGFIGIMLPYFRFSLLFLLIDAIAMLIDPLAFDLNRLYKHIIETVGFTGISLLGFLPAYFLAVSFYRMFRHYFSFLWMAVILSLVALVLLFILYYRSYAGLADIIPSKFGFSDYGMLIARLFWKGTIGMFYCMWGEAMERIRGALQKKMLLNVIAGFAAIAAGIVLSLFCAEADYKEIALGNPLLGLPKSMLMCGGLYLLCSWIRTIRPLDFLGRHGIIVLVSGVDLWLLPLAKWLGDKVFAFSVNNFATRATVALVTLLLELLVIWILRMGCFRFLFSGRDWKAAELEEEI